jgi:NAD(P)-dependent dehydrogenase (short-subunit alcohol dehydrogenase family)
MTAASPAFQNTAVLVTGAASGIGAATVRTFKSAGALVAGLDRAGINSEADLNLVADVSIEDDVTRAVAEVYAAFGRLDVMVASAGISHYGTILEVEPHEWDAVFAVNVRGVFLCARAVIPNMRRAGHGVIVTVASQLGIVVAPQTAVYCASKGAVIQLTKALALDHSHEGIRVSCVCPGPTQTPMLERRFAKSPDREREERRVTEAQVTGTFVTPEEIAAGIVYLASPEARSAVGAVLVIDGGYTLR